MNHTRIINPTKKGEAFMYCTGCPWSTTTYYRSDVVDALWRIHLDNRSMTERETEILTP